MKPHIHPADRPLLTILLLAVAVPLPLCASVPVRADEPEAEMLETHSQSPYVHRITLYDHDGAAINPADEPALPYSPHRTCGKCHPYAEIAHGWHFNAADPSVPPGRPGEPWFIVDEQADTVCAISGRGWPGTITAEKAGLSSWQFVKQFGHHTPGGGLGEPGQEAVDASDEWLRWGVSGRLEIDCLMCHSADMQHDPAEAARQIEKENFRWLPTVALGLAVVRGEARKAPDEWDAYTPPDPDHPEQAGPTLIYDRTRFDPDDRVFFNVTRRVLNERCYFCHTLREVGPHAPDDWTVDQDVHLAAGLICVDCHRHGMDHNIARGYEGEAHATTQPAKAALTCRGCHMGTAEADSITAALGGRLRAPYPEHAGLPPVHLEKLTCTACHSGPWPEMTPHRFQTAMAHGLGIATREDSDDTEPWIFAPVFGKDEAGQIAPQRLVVTRTAGADPAVYRWSLAHNVRPAAQALGVRGCTDCHEWPAPIMAGQFIAGNVDLAKLLMPQYDPQDMLALRDDERPLARIWSLCFTFRPVFKWFGFICAGVIALVLLRGALDALACLNGRCAPQTSERTLTTGAQSRAGWLIPTILVLGVLLLATTGFTSALLLDELSEWLLLAHMAGAPLFIFGLTGAALLWPARLRQQASPWPRVMFWTMLVLGFVTMLTMLAAMLPVFGYAAQEALAEVHEYTAHGLVFALLLLGITLVIGRRTKTQCA